MAELARPRGRRPGSSCSGCSSRPHPAGSRRTRSRPRSTTCATTAPSWSSRCPPRGGGRNGSCGVRRNVRRRWQPAALLSVRTVGTPHGDARVHVAARPAAGRHPGAQPRRRRRHRGAPTWTRWPPRCPREASPCSWSSSRGGSPVARWPRRRRRSTRRGWRCSRRCAVRGPLVVGGRSPAPGWPAAPRRSSARSASSPWPSRCTRRAGRRSPGARARPAGRAGLPDAGRAGRAGPLRRSAGPSAGHRPDRAARRGRRPLVPGAQGRRTSRPRTAALVVGGRWTGFVATCRESSPPGRG